MDSADDASIPTDPQLWRDGEPTKLDPRKIQLCRVGVHSTDARATGQNCDCPVETCRMWNGGLKPAVTRQVNRLTMRFKPCKTELMPPHVLRAFYNNWRLKSHLKARSINGFDLFVDRESSMFMTTVWIRRSEIGSGLRIWKAEIPNPFVGRLDA